MLIRVTRGFASSYPRGGTLASWLAEQVDFAVAIRAAAVLYFTALVAMTAGLALIFLGGVSWLAFAYPAPSGRAAALDAGLYSFVAADLVKLAVAAAALPGLWRLTGLRDHLPRTKRY